MEILQLILLQVITFVVIILILRFLFGTQLKLALGRLQTLHQESLEKEDILNKELEKAKVQAQNEIARSKEEAKSIVGAARSDAAKIAEEAREDAQAQIKKALAEAEEKARRIEGDILATAEKKAVSLVQELFAYLFTPKGQEAVHTQLIDELIDELEKVDPARLNVKVEKAEVLTSVPLSADEKKRIRQILVSKVGSELSLEEKVDTSLIMGVMIRLGGLVVDGSFKNRLNKALAILRQKSPKTE